MIHGVVCGDNRGGIALLLQNNGHYCSSMTKGKGHQCLAGTGFKFGLLIYAVSVKPKSQQMSNGISQNNVPWKICKMSMFLGLLQHRKGRKLSQWFLLCYFYLAEHPQFLHRVLTVWGKKIKKLFEAIMTFNMKCFKTLVLNMPEHRTLKMLVLVGGSSSGM